MADGPPRDPDDLDDFDFDLTMFDDELPGLAAYDPNAPRPAGGWGGEMDHEAVLYPEAEVVDVEDDRHGQRPAEQPSRKRRLLIGLLVATGLVFVGIATVAVASGPDDSTDRLRVTNDRATTSTTFAVRAPAPAPLVSLATTTTTEPPTTTTEAPPPPPSTTSAPRPAPTVVTVAPESEAEQEPEVPPETEPPPTTTLDPSTTTTSTTSSTTTTTTLPPNQPST
jgi:hypothetical protein